MQEMQRHKSQLTGLTIIALASIVLSACSPNITEHRVIAATGTVIGVKVSRNPATQWPEAELGYNRTELALVPSNRRICVLKDDTLNCGKDGDAKEVADVLMELRYAGIFDWGEGAGIYQRLAVGKNAVGQPGAAFIFAKDATGNVSDESAKALQEYYRETTAQEQQAAGILRCYLGVKREKRLEVWTDAQQRSLFHDPTSLSVMRSLHEKAQRPSTTQEKKEEANRKADRRYASEIFISTGRRSTRTEMMETHRQKVCELARHSSS